MKILMIGGTGTISSSITALLAKDQKVELYVLNRGHKPLPSHVTQWVADIQDTQQVKKLLGQHTFDVVLDFIVYQKQQALQRIDLFLNRTRQYIFISTVVTFDHELSYVLNEDSPKGNRFSAYGQEKYACERIFMEAYKHGFPVTIVRPSQTYGYDRFPLSVKGKNCYSVIHRILNDEPVIIHGDGKATWHMMHTFDFAYNFIRLIGQPKAIGQSINLVNPLTVTWDMIYDELGRQLHRTVKKVHLPSDLLALSKTYNFHQSILGDKQYSHEYSLLQVERLINDFQCTIDLEKGVKMYLEYIWKHPEVQVVDEMFDAWCNDVIEAYREFEDRFVARF